MQLLNPLVLLVVSSAGTRAATSITAEMPSTLPTFPASVSELSAASTILATATPSPNVGNPANILSYPLCVVSYSPGSQNP